jgi:OmpA-OmpF porin, OOP family
MTLFKKIFYFLIIFVILNIITIYNYDYFTNKTEKIPFSFTIEKTDNMLKLSGIFSNENDLKIVSNTLKIDKKENLTYNEDVFIDYLLIEKLNPFIEKFNENAINGAKISYTSKGLEVVGDVKSEDSIKILNEINSKNNLLATLNIKVSVVQDVGKLAEEVQEIIQNDTKNEELAVVKVPIIKEVQDKINSILKDNKITFARASTDLTPESIKIVELIANILKEYNFNIEVGGHTDSKGNPKLNQKLSDERALAVKNNLIKFGLNEQNIKSFGYGNKFPIAQEDELGLSEDNRRVEIILKETIKQ